MPEETKPQPVYERAPGEGALHQGEILANVDQVRMTVGTFAARIGDELEVEWEQHPLAVVVTQACDLDWDYKARNGVVVNGKQVSETKLVPSVLLLDVFEAAKIRGTVVSKIWERIRDNKDDRYHFLERAPAEQDAAGEGLPETCIDFKRCFTVPTTELYARLGAHIVRRSRLTVPYREHLNARLGYYLLRVGLPRDHASEPGGA